METITASAPRAQAGTSAAMRVECPSSRRDRPVGVVAVGLIVRVGEKAEAEAVAFDDRAVVRLLGGVAGADRRDAVLGQPVERESTP